MKRRSDIDLPSATRLINSLCDIAHGTNELEALRTSRSSAKLRKAIRSHDDKVIFSWLMRTFSYQGLSDRAVEQYIEENGNADYTGIEASLSDGDCEKLEGFWKFQRCGYEKTKHTCSCRSKIVTCPLPKLPLRNGRLNQLAYSLFFFLRDIANGDLVTFLDQIIETLPNQATTREVHLSLVPPWRSIFGISDKVITMALATLLMSASLAKPKWRTAGSALIVVDTLVHNFLQRTGIDGLLGTQHLYGPKCYQAGGCFDIIGAIAEHVDARRFNSDFPAYFPRFVQFAVWKYCSQSHWNICNGNQIDDKARCSNGSCYLCDDCKRHVLKG